MAAFSFLSESEKELFHFSATCSSLARFMTKRIALIHDSNVSGSLPMMLLSPYPRLPYPNLPSTWFRLGASFFCTVFLTGSLAVNFWWPSQGFTIDLNPFFFQAFAVFPFQENLVSKQYPGLAAIGLFEIFYLHFQIRTFIVGIPAEPVYPAESVHLTDIDFRSKFGFRFVFSPDNRTYMGL